MFTKARSFFQHFPVDCLIEKEKILEKCKEIKPDAITSVASDLATLTVNYLAEKLGLAGNSLECTKISTNKYEMRKAFQNFAWGQSSFNENILKNMEIRLPVDSNDNIDYTYITTFIQAQEKLSIKSVIDWKDKIINTSKKCI